MKYNHTRFPKCLKAINLKNKNQKLGVIEVTNRKCYLNEYFQFFLNGFLVQKAIDVEE